MTRHRWDIPQGLKVYPDGSWRIGEYHVIHPPSLRYFKSHLVREEAGVYIVDGGQRMAVDVQGPAFHAVSLVLDTLRSGAHLVLDDGTVEPLADDAVGMNRDTGRFEASVRQGRFAALLDRGPHQILLDNLEQEGGRFFLVVGERRIRVRT